MVSEELTKGLSCSETTVIRLWHEHWRALPLGEGNDGPGCEISSGPGSEASNVHSVGIQAGERSPWCSLCEGGGPRIWRKSFNQAGNKCAYWDQARTKLRSYRNSSFLLSQTWGSKGTVDSHIKAVVKSSFSAG